MITLHLGDCLEIMRTMPAGSVDAIITDLPYGTTACKWDTVIPFAPMWEVVKHVLKPRGVFVTTASQPFTSALVMSNPAWFRYEWIWEKDQAGIFMTAKISPMKVHENIVVFSEKGHNYNPIMEKREDINIKKTTSDLARMSNSIETAGGFITIRSRGYDKNVRYPRSVQKFNNPDRNKKGNIKHPTQKPVALYEYLILTYTNPGETVLDMCAGSGTTGVAAIKTGRNAILIERDPAYFAIIERRIADAQQQPRLEEVQP